MITTAPSRAERGFSRARRERVRLAILATLLLTCATLPVLAQAQSVEKKSGTSTAAPRDLHAEATRAAAATTQVNVAAADLSGPALSVQTPVSIQVPATGTQGPAGPYPANLVVSGLPNKIGRLAVRLNNVAHTYPGDLQILLVGPAGQKVMLLQAAGAGHAIDGVDLTFQDGAPLATSAPLVTGSYAPTTLGEAVAMPSPAPTIPYTSSLADFVGTNPNGIWSLYVNDRAGGDLGVIDGFTLLISPQFTNTTLLAIPDDGPSVDSTLAISGLTAPIAKVTASLHISHTYDADLHVDLVGPNGVVVPLAIERGGSGDNFGTACSTGSQTTFDDSAATAISGTTAPFVGSLRPDGNLAVFNGMLPGIANGIWKLRLTDIEGEDTGTLHCWSLNITQDESATLQTPTGLRATAINGNQLSLRWTPPSNGPAPTSYILEGGVLPGETIVTLPTGSTVPALTLEAPTGVFTVRMRAESNGSVSAPSNEIQVFVNVPAPPSPPIGLQSVNSGSSASLSWQNTFGGGAPTSLLLEVTRSEMKDMVGEEVIARIPVPLSESVTFEGVPDGNYAVAIRAVNAGGVSAAAGAAGVYPATSCGGVPTAPAHLLTYRAGNTIYVTWDRPLDTDSYAATGFLINVTGAFVGGFPVTERTVFATVGAGTYNISVAATNFCGTGAFTPVQSVTIP